MRRFLALWLAGLLLAAVPVQESLGQTARRADPIRLQPQRAGQTDVYILSFGLWGPQSVFESEARGAARVLEQQFGAKGRSIVRFNTKRRAGATPETLAAAAEAAGRTLDPAEDVVVLVLTSHGAPEGIGLVAGRDTLLVTPGDVRDLLEKTRAQHRVVIVSACYSGVFAQELADERTLVITAAAADKPSFGCRDGATWTYFGDAFFNKALRREPRLDTAFETARGLVTRREKREGFDPSNPQLAGGAQVLEKLQQTCRISPAQQACRCERPSARSAAC
ncbi:C13 family peptidase [Microvirga splendida]|uniref:Peptidase C13, legumain asparaginyl peptidase n=1 Tax=Microvirga splendida TaxID=2795727 RepID=A0ABS0XXM7_9HYPH|nr:C13 family peptidase [Microvirga splendida]MBJ6124794.1 peptidase C13, legumain asparaginyl peptidase [Microvirga splendida]